MMKLKKSLIKLKKQKKNVDREKLVYETNEYTHSFKNFQTIKTLDRDIYEGKITIEEADKYQTDLLAEIMNLKKKIRNKRVKKKNKKKKMFLKICIIFGRAEKNS